MTNMFVTDTNNFVTRALSWGADYCSEPDGKVRCCYPDLVVALV